MSCSINPTSWGSCVGAGLGKAAGGLAAAGMDGIASAFATGVGKIVATLATFWTTVPTVSLTGANGPVAMITGMLDWLMLVVGVMSIFLVAIRLAITQSGEVLQEAGIGLVRFVIVTSVQVPTVALLAAAGDLFSAWILNVASGGHFGTRVVVVFGAAIASGGLGSAVVFIVALLTILSSLGQVIAMVFRNGVLVLTAGASPVFGAAAIYKGNEDAWRKLWTWQLAFVLYKPAAALVYATAFVMVGDGKTPIDVLSGMGLMIMSVLALPALLRLMMPVAAKISAGGGAGAALAGAGAVASGVAAVHSAKSGRGPSGANSTGGQQSPPAQPGPSGANAGEAAGGAARGATAAAGPAGAAMAGAAQAMGATKQMASAGASTGSEQS